MYIDANLIVHGSDWHNHAVCEVPTNYLEQYLLIFSLDDWTFSAIEEELEIRSLR